MKIGYLYVEQKRKMKKTILSLALACLTGLSAQAQLNGDGYYRIQNAITKRYMSLTDNHSDGVNYNNTSIEAAALLTIMNWDEVVTDPGTIFYIEKVGNEYNLKGQGIDMHGMIGYYICLVQKGEFYLATQTQKGVTVYLNDDWDFTKGENLGHVLSIGSATKAWSIKPVNTDNNYLGVKPIVKANGKYYASFYAGYPVSAASEGITFYYISSVDENNGVVKYKKIEGTVPAATPVLIECSSDNPADNKLKVETQDAAKIQGNKLTGTYFGIGSDLTAHYNFIKFDANSMRYLGVGANGELTFNNSDQYMSNVLEPIPGEDDSDYYPTVKAIPHNTGFLKVSSNCPKELKMELETSGIKDIVADDNKPANIYNLNGMIVRKGATTVENLPKGVYIFKNKKVVVK